MMEKKSNRIGKMLEIYQHMVLEVEALELLFCGRHFTLDGHLIGSIGEAIAQDEYGIELNKASFKDFDGISSGIPVQIKMVQQDKVQLRCDERSIPQRAYLLVLYLNKCGRYYEVYNGSFQTVWNVAGKMDKNGYKHISVNRLIDLQNEEKSIRSNSFIEPMRPEYKNVRK